MNEIIIKTTIPIESCYKDFIINIDYFDVFEMKLEDEKLTIENIYSDIFNFVPSWVEGLLKVRNKIVGFFNLKVDISLNSKRENSLEIGKKSGLFTIYNISENEIIAGEEDKHLDFIVSVLKANDRVTISTLVKYHNIFGKVYMFFVIPFHKIIVQVMMKNYIKNKKGK